MSIAPAELLDSNFYGSNLKLAIKNLINGEPVLLLDDEDRENEGDLVIAAEKITEKSMNFLIQKGSGIVCLAMSKQLTDELNLSLMVPKNNNSHDTAFTVSIEAKFGTSTGVSARDRAHTIKTALMNNAQNFLKSPGHVFPLVAKENGVFERMGHTEGSVDLMRICQLKPAAVLCELMDEHGSMILGKDRITFAKEFSIPILSVQDILFHRIKNEAIENISSQFGSLHWHRFKMYEDTLDILLDPRHEFHNLMIVDGFDIKNRYISLALGKKDDVLSSAISAIKTQQTLVAFHEKHKSDDRRIKALICRALLELGVEKIQTEDEDFIKVADYFGLSAQGKTGLVKSWL